MQTRTSFSQSLLQHKPTILQTNKISVGQSFFMTMLSKVVYIDMIGIMIKDDLAQIRAKLIYNIVNIQQCALSQDEFYQICGQIFIHNDLQMLQKMRYWMLKLLTYQYDQSMLIQVNNSDQYSQFQYTHTSSQLVNQTQQNNQSNIQTNQNQNKLQNSFTNLQSTTINDKQFQKLIQNLNISEVPPVINKNNKQYQTKPWIQCYLSSIQVCRSQLNLFCQQLKIPNVYYKKYRSNNKYFVQASMKMRNCYTNYQSQIYVGYGNSYNFKFACEKAANQLIYEIYDKTPFILYDFVRIKRSKQII